MSGIDSSLFSHATPDIPACPKCGAPMVFRRSAKGTFLGCSRHPDCDGLRELHPHEHGILKVLDNAPCPACGQPLAVINGRYGMFIGCTEFPRCHYTVTNAQKQQQQPPQVKETIACPSCRSGQLVERQARNGKTFWACNRYPKCQFAVNDPPVAQNCPECGYQLLVERELRGKRYLCCPHKHCNYQSQQL